MSGGLGAEPLRHGTRPQPGLLLVNLGTPDAPETGAVRRYLAEFLTDWRVIDVRAWLRYLLVFFFILPFRPRRSAEAYRKIWTPEGSPLLRHAEGLAEKLRARLGPEIPVAVGMRYGQPSIDAALDRLTEAGADRVVVVPLYPQFSASATGSAIEAVLRAAARRWNTPYLSVVPPFFDHPAFLQAVAERARPVLRDQEPDHVVLSFHGLPERQVRRSDLSGGAHCLQSPGCCDQLQSHNRFCYRAQCFATARLLTEQLGLSDDGWTLTFQSRLGRDPWLQPHTDRVLADLARGGVRRVVVLSPAFVADCLETLEELAIRGQETFQAAGGEELVLVPSLNASDDWADALLEIVQETAPYVRLREGRPA